MTTLDRDQLVTVTGGIVEGGCVQPPPGTPRFPNVENPVDRPPPDLSQIGTIPLPTSPVVSGSIRLEI